MQGQSPAGAPVSQKAGDTKAAQTTTPKLRQKTFEKVWRTVKEKHYDPNLGGVDWNKVREQYAPRVVSAKSDEEFYDLLNLMLSELHQTHLAVVSPEQLKTGDSKSLGGIGIGLYLVDGLPVITRVEKGSAAERAGLRQGFVIQKIDGKTIEQIGARNNRYYGTPAILRARLIRTLLKRIYGEPGTLLRLEYQDELGATREASLVREQRQGEVALVGGVIPKFLEFESKRLASGIGYIRFSEFTQKINGRLRDAISSLNDAPGLVIDLRGNGGGDNSVFIYLAGLLSKEKTSLGTSRSRTGVENYSVKPQKNPYNGPVVVLIDVTSGSSSEQLAAGLQETGRAIVIGETSQGANLDADATLLPTGALLLYISGEPRGPKGNLIEGRGVTPDIEVKLTRDLLLKGGDPQLEEAIRYIQNHSR